MDGQREAVKSVVAQGMPPRGSAEATRIRLSAVAKAATVTEKISEARVFSSLQGSDLNRRPLGYEYKTAMTGNPLILQERRPRYRDPCPGTSPTLMTT